MTRRSKVIWWSFGSLVALAAIAAAAVVVLVQTGWGRERVRRLVAAQVNRSLAGGSRLFLGRIEGGFSGRYAIDSASLMDNRGQVIAAVARIEFSGSLAGLLSRDVRITRLLVVRPYLTLEQRRNGSWNVADLFPKGRPPTNGAGSSIGVSIDSAVVHDGFVRVVTPDSQPRLPPTARDVSHLEMDLARVRIGARAAGGGGATVRNLALRLSLPALSLVRSAGEAHWWTDSLALDLQSLHLPASHGAAHLTVAWPARIPVRVDALIHADRVTLADIGSLSALIPRSGTASATVRVRSGPSLPDLVIALSNLDLSSVKSRLTGGFTVVTGRVPAVRDLAIDARPLDLDLVRAVFGDSVPKKVWQGALTGTIRGRGGLLDAIAIDSANLTFADRRSPGAVSHVSFAGSVDVKSRLTTLHGFAVEVHDLDVHTLGAVVHAADSLRGRLTGRLVLDGPLSNISFHDLLLWHVDGDRQPSRVSGAGRLASDTRAHWLDASLLLDTVAVATIAGDRSPVPLRGVVRGTLELHATADTMSMEASLRAGDGTAHLVGQMRLDSTRTWMRGRATFAAMDPRVLIATKDIPLIRVGGTAEVDVDGDARRTDAHLSLVLDTTSVIGASRIAVGRLRLGADSAGVYVDSADIRAADWRLSASGRLARAGVTHDTLRFAAAFDSLPPLWSLLVDNAGVARLDSLDGAVGAAGTLVGSLDTLTLTADIGARGVRAGGVLIGRAAGHVEMARLPHAATGTVTLTADSIGAGRLTADRLHARADVSGGRLARITMDVVSGDTLGATTTVDVRRSSDTTFVSVDSLSVALSGRHWRLDRAAHVVVGPRSIVVDSVVVRSAGGATIAVVADIPDTGATSGSLRVDHFGLDEIAFTELLSPDLAGTLRAVVTLTGTRDDPHLALSAALDSVRMGDRDVPTLAATGTYGGRRANADVRGAFHGRELLVVGAALPVDLSLGHLPARVLGDSLRVTVHADSAALAGLESVVPQATGFAGTLSADVTFLGTWQQVVGRGTLRVRDGAFELSKFGTAAREVVADLSFAGDSIVVQRLRMSDAVSRQDTMAMSGTLFRSPTGWRMDVTSAARTFNLMDDPQLAQLDATWLLHLTGPIKQPTLSGDVTLPSATLVIDQRRHVRAIRDESGSEDAELRFGMPIISSLHVTLGNNVRLKSQAANVQLSGALEVAGQLSRPYLFGQISANRGTYRVDLGMLKRTFRVDSGAVFVSGTTDIPPSLDIYASYVVRRPDLDDITVNAHLTGTTDAPRLELQSTDLGSALQQSEIISYLIFGTPTFALDGQGQTTVRNATAALVPSLGGVLEGVLGTLFPFFNSLQVTTVAGSGPQNLVTSPLDALLNSFALTGGRQLGSDSFLNVSGGICRGSRLSSAQSSPGWFGLSVEYRPKLRLSAVASLDPGSAPCNRVGAFANMYQFGLDLFRDWRF